MEKLFLKKWSYGEFLKFIMPSVLAMLFTSIYVIVDGIFVSRFVGINALAAINIVFPIYNLVLGVGIMLSVGASAFVSIELGKNNSKRANEYFSFISVVHIVFGMVILAFGIANMKKLLISMGATDKLMPHCVDYASVLLFAMPFLLIKICFEYFLRVDGKADMAFWLTVMGGVLNIIFDYIFIRHFGWGIQGAGYATALGIIASSLMPAYYFALGDSNLKFVRFKADWGFLTNVIVNGSSEMVTELSSGITTIIFNTAILKYAGETGVAGISIILYIYFLFISLSIGVTIGIQPVISFSYGSENFKKIRDTVRQSSAVIIISSIAVFVAVEIWGVCLIRPFTGADVKALDLTSRGLKLFSWSLLVCGMNILGSGFFTAINKGKVSALISLSRSLIFVLIGIAALPVIFKIDGIWLSIPFAEFATIFITLSFMKESSVKTLY